MGERDSGKPKRMVEGWYFPELERPQLNPEDMVEGELEFWQAIHNGLSISDIWGLDLDETDPQTRNVEIGDNNSEAGDEGCVSGRI